MLTGTVIQLVPLAKIRDDTWVSEACARFKADDQMRQRYNAKAADCPLPRLYGLSLLGTYLRVHVRDGATGEIEPTFKFTNRPSPVQTLPDDFLEGAWNIDILSQEGFAKMK